MAALKQIEYSIPERLLRFVGGDIKKEAKLVAARGMLPIPPVDLVQVLFALTREADPDLSKTAGATLVKMPENILKTICDDQKSHPLILDYLARRLQPDSPLQEAITLNKSTHDDTVVHQAAYTNKKVVTIIAENQIRILRCPEIVDALAENVLTGQAQLERIIKFVEMESKRSEKSAPAPVAAPVVAPVVAQVPPPAQPAPEDGEEPPPDEEEEEVSTVTVDEEEISAVTMEEVGDSPWSHMKFDSEMIEAEKDVDDLDAEDEKDNNLYNRIQHMKISQKIKLALMGGSSARALLIRDSNKMVAVAVMKSPRLTNKEIETISKSRSVCDDVIRMVAGSREWTRTYSIKMNLIQNPKTPQSDAMRFLNFLRDKDLRDISRSRNVPNNIAGQAKRLIARKEQKGKPKKKS